MNMVHLRRPRRRAAVPAVLLLLLATMLAANTAAATRLPEAGVRIAGRRALLGADESAPLIVVLEVRT